MDLLIRSTSYRHEPWNRGKLVGQKAPLKLKDIQAIRVRLQLGERARELALFNLATGWLVSGGRSLTAQKRPPDYVPWADGRRSGQLQSLAARFKIFRKETFGLARNLRERSQRQQTRDLSG